MCQYFISLYLFRLADHGSSTLVRPTTNKVPAVFIICFNFNNFTKTVDTDNFFQDYPIQ